MVTNFVRSYMVYCTLNEGEEEEMKPGRDLQTYYLRYAEMWVSACMWVCVCGSVPNTHIQYYIPVVPLDVL